MSTTTVGLISDTHGVLPEAAKRALRGSALIVHAGDIGTEDVLVQLRSLAPVVAARGNVDRGVWAEVLPESEVVEIGGIALYVLHDLGTLDLEPSACGFAAVISGHTHRPASFVKKGVHYLNPGYAGRKRFAMPMSVMLLRIGDQGLAPELVYLEEGVGVR
jgi:putative phosphoesterase